MDDRIKCRTFKDRLHGAHIEEVDTVVRDRASCNLNDTSERFSAAIVVVVNHADKIATLQQFEADVRPDVPRAASDEHALEPSAKTPRRR
jgi:hypothetical protein|tara:strand:- start:73 stop:342 length:270 start_codon:yes stop_codon:yes gene_type:complete